MILEKIKEQVIRAVQAGIQSADSRFENEAIEDMIRLERVEMISEYVNGSRAVAGNEFIPSQWSLSRNVDIEPSAQEEDAQYLVLSKPKMVPINKHSNGVLYLGKQKSPKSFVQVKSWEQASMALTLGEIYPNGGEHFLDDGDRFVIFGNMSLKRLKLVGIPEIPEDFPNFNVYTDDYPIPYDALSRLIVRVATKLSPASRQMPDMVNSGNDVTAPKVAK